MEKEKEQAKPKEPTSNKDRLKEQDDYLEETFPGSDPIAPVHPQQQPSKPTD
ncbi:hypothetical protein [Agrobacterium vitis]|uniref:hypothetical protein n=1 Tax=Agrobacterium vitis TaxID=373 RepID=UPI003D2AB950